MRRALSVAALPLAAAGCFSVPPFTPEGGVSYTEADGGAVVGGPDFELRFAGGEGFHFPDSLKVGGVELFGRDPAARCLGEDEVGVRIVPGPRISANGGAPRVTNRLETVLRGPAAVQMKLEWATSFGCNPARTPGGLSTFTVFPDGRIVRFDKIADPTSSELVPINCTCDPMPRQEELSFTISTFWTLGQKFDEIYPPGNSSPTPLPMPGLGFSNLGASCVTGANGAYQVAFGWPASEVQGSMTSIRDRGPTITFGRDLVFGASMLGAFSYTSSSALFIGRNGTCAEALKRAEAYAERTPIMINGASTMPSERDGIFGGDPGAGMPGIVAERAVVAGPVSGSFAVWLRFPGSVDAVRATLNGMAVKGAWYIPQRADDGSWIVWFRDGISASQTIEIAPY